MRIDLIRHGDTGRAGHFDGRTDLPLSDVGWMQMESRTSDRMWPLIVCSPLIRARVAAEALAKSSGARLIVDANWSEMDFGDWDGRARSEIESTPLGREQIAAFYRDPRVHAPPQAESWDKLEHRVQRAIARLIAEADSDPALVITHAGPMRAALAVAMGLPLGALWAIRLGYGTRLSLEIGKRDGRIWGELLEITQP